MLTGRWFVEHDQRFCVTRAPVFVDGWTGWHAHERGGLRGGLRVVGGGRGPSRWGLGGRGGSRLETPCKPLGFLPLVLVTRGCNELGYDCRDGRRACKLGGRGGASAVGSVRTVTATMCSAS